MEIKLIFSDELKEKISKITSTEYKELGDIECLIEDLIYYYEHLEEEFEDYKEYVKENYNMKSPYEIYGISKEDFYEN